MKSNTFLLFVVIASVSPFENGTPSEKGHKHRRIETIPVDDDNLLQPEIPEAVEEMLANVRIAPNVNTGRQRRTGKKYPWPSLQSQQDETKESSIQVHKSAIFDQVNPGESYSREELLNDHDLNPTDSAKLLLELTHLKEEIDKEIAKLQNESTSSTTTNDESNVIVRAARELVRKAELASRSKRQSESEILLPYRACIYIDIPGMVNPVEGGKPFLPETFNHACQEKSVVTETAIQDKQALGLSSSQVDDESETASVDDVLWLHMPPNDPLDSDKIRTELYDTIDTLHHAGNDVLFIPISKGYSDTEEVKHGFLKSLQITPERFSRFRKLKIKRL
ncbi:uncharacterized protein LOC110856111 [Folsomia candida]|uniref:Uncharacterized protein n=1 Tax=Folsomia candida TaxID=158441 RepID=A0A226DQW9_FOLCA|nr:uncharacterized protein LOC110856111 [Folsomia candida]OXA47067.1 hypothetical protein Fcan01_18457 [Folsomia candida]